MEKNNLTVPVAIVVAGVLVAGALFITRGGAVKDQQVAAQPELPNTDSIVMDPVTAADHIQGDPNAPVLIVEYSDTECPFCKQFQDTMHQVMDEYGKDGKVAWVYRHFPLFKPGSDGTALHPRAEKEAEATECVNELGGNDKFWDFINLIYTVTPSNNGLDPAQLPILAAQVGIDKDKFNACLSSGKYTDKINTAYTAALAAGATGTPYSVIITRDGTTKIPINGAQPFSAVKPVLDTLLSKQS